MISPYALIYLFAYIAPAAIGFAAMIVYTHLLSPGEYGVYIVGSSIAGIIAAMFFTWVRLSVSRYQARSPELDLRAEAAVGYGATALAVACVAPLVLLFVHPGIDSGAVIASLFLSLSLTGFEIAQEFRRAHLDPLRFTVIAVVRSMLALALGVAVIALGGGGIGLLAAVAASYLAASLFGASRTQRGAPRSFSVEHLAQFMRYGLPFTLGATFIALHNSLDRLSIAYLLGESSAGHYGVAADMTRQIINILGSSVASAMFPLAFRTLAESGPAATRSRLAEGVELLFALLLPATVWLALSADALSSTLLGAEFQATTALLLPVLAFGRMCGAVNQWYVHASFQLAERPLLQVAHDGSVLVLNLALLFPLTLAFGLMGTAAAVLIAEACGIAVGATLTRRAFRLPLNFRGLARVVAATAIMAAVVYALRLALGGHAVVTLLALLVGGGIAYAGAALVLDVAGSRALAAGLFRRLARERSFRSLPNNAA